MLNEVKYNVYSDNLPLSLVSKSIPTIFQAALVGAMTLTYWASLRSVRTNKNMLPPVDDSFQYAPLTRVDSNPSQLNRFWMAIVSQTKPLMRARK
ncbi:hypothetical protein [Aeromonas enteropelogenes]|uniref:hypothetical protein n=1 Tax=Aeromonas enteropelogenes TaxID=29489 RepID=UPI003B9E906A